MRFTLTSFVRFALGVFLVQLSQARTLPLPSEAHTNVTLETRTDGPRLPRERQIFLVFELNMRYSLLSSNGARELYDTHAFLQYGPTAEDGPFRLEITFYRARNEYAIRGLDLGLESANREIGATSRNGDVREIFQLQRTTSLTNAQIFSKEDGTGIALNVWARNPRYRVGGMGHPQTNDCNSFVGNMMRGMFGREFKIPRRAASLLRNSIEYSDSFRKPLDVQITTFFHESFKTPGVIGSGYITSAFDVRDPTRPVRLNLDPRELVGPIFTNNAPESPDELQGLEPNRDPSTENPVSASPFESMATTPFDDSPEPPAMNPFGDLASTPFPDRVAAPVKPAAPPKAEGAQMASPFGNLANQPFER